MSPINPYASGTLRPESLDTRPSCYKWCAKLGLIGVFAGPLIYLLAIGLYFQWGGTKFGIDPALVGEYRWVPSALDRFGLGGAIAGTLSLCVVYCCGNTVQRLIASLPGIFSAVELAKMLMLIWERNGL